jgi:hypothetical protein
MVDESSLLEGRLDATLRLGLLKWTWAGGKQTAAFVPV